VNPGLLPGPHQQLIGVNQGDPSPIAVLPEQMIHPSHAEARCAKAAFGAEYERVGLLE
jgi:hypothetical protein